MRNLVSASGPIRDPRAADLNVRESRRSGLPA